MPHFASLRGKRREIIVLRSDNGETWKEHTLEANEEAIQDVLNHSFEGEGEFAHGILWPRDIICFVSRTKSDRRLAHESNNSNFNERLSSLLCRRFSNKARSARDWT